MAESIDWNKEAYYSNACPELNAIEFDLQYEQNARNSAVNNNCTNPPHFPPHCGCPAG